MTTINRILLVLILIGGRFKVHAAVRRALTTHTQGAIKLFKRAEGHIFRREYGFAINDLKDALRKDKKFAEAYISMASVYRNLGDFKEAKDLLIQAEKYLPFKKKYINACYRLSFLYYRVGDYEKANVLLQKTKRLKPITKGLAQKMDQLQSNIDFSLDRVNHPIPFHPTLLPEPINGLASQGFPVLTIDGKTLLFTGRETQDIYGKEAIYVSYKNDEGEWSKPELLSKNINSRKNEGTCTISADGKMLVFTACGRKENYGICDLYVSYKKGNTWSKPINLGPNVNSSGWESQPSLAANGDVLYFTSNQAGSYGKKDIWKTIRLRDGSWSKAVNLGPVINSGGKEISPFIHSNGKTLFFASDRNPHMGGFDLYFSNYINGKWTKPVSLGYPINTFKDQMSLFITADGRKAYYADGRKEGAHYYSRFLYEFDVPESFQPYPRSDYVQGKVVEAFTQDPVGAEVVVFDLKTNKKEFDLKVDKDSGEFFIVLNEGKEYGIHINKDGYVFKTVYADFTKGNLKVDLPGGKIILQPIKEGVTEILESVFFDFDEAIPKKESETALESLVEFMQKYTKVNIRIDGHTDVVGTEAYNLDLSKRRAKYIYDYLIEEGIAQSRLKYQGHGSKKPIAPNTSSKNRQRNRRTAFQIIAH